jgi:SprA-related family
VNNINAISSFAVSPLGKTHANKGIEQKTEETKGFAIDQQSSSNLVAAIVENDVKTPFAPIVPGATSKQNPESTDKKKGLETKDATFGKPDSKSITDTDISTKEQQQVDKLQKIDREVRAHERAHQAAGGGLVRGGASFSYTTGPDGRQYAVGGEVQIDMSSEKDPAATIRKMQQVKRAALAPSDPSGTDRSVALAAAQVEAQARRELQSQREEGSENIIESTQKASTEVEANFKKDNAESTVEITNASGFASLKKYRESEQNNEPQKISIYA